MKNKAFFLDRDGTIIIDKGYLDNPANIEFIDGIPETLQKIKACGYLIVMVSNQSGVARGYFTEDTVQCVNEAVQERLQQEYGIKLDGMYYCPHHPVYGKEIYNQDCDCRKPKPGMILQAAQDLDIDINSSVMIGDKESDRIELEGLHFIKIEKDCNWANNDGLKKYI